MKYSTIILLLMLLTACSALENPEEQASQDAQSTAFVQTISAMETRQPTLVAMQATAEQAVALSDQVAQLNQQNQSLQSTIVALNSGSAVVQPQPVPTQQQAQPQAQAGSVASVAGTTPTPVPQLNQAQPTIASGSTYQQTAAAVGVDDNDCATDTGTVFDGSNVNTIYLTTVAVNVQPGTVYSSRWFYNNAMVYDSPFEWTPQQFYDQTCIWFSADAEDITMLAGEYTAELTANGQVVTRATFQITGSTSPAGGVEDEMDDMNEP